MMLPLLLVPTGAYNLRSHDLNMRYLVLGRAGGQKHFLGVEELRHRLGHGETALVGGLLSQRDPHLFTLRKHTRRHTHTGHTHTQALVSQENNSRNVGYCNACKKGDFAEGVFFSLLVGSQPYFVISHFSIV